MSGCEPEEVIDLQGDIDDGLATVDPDVEAWVDDGSGLDDLTSTEVDGFEEPVLDEVEPDDPFVPLDDDGGDPPASSATTWSAGPTSVPRTAARPGSTSATSPSTPRWSTRTGRSSARSPSWTTWSPSSP